MRSIQKKENKKTRSTTINTILIMENFTILFKKVEADKYKRTTRFLNPEQEDLLTRFMGDGLNVIILNHVEMARFTFTDRGQTYSASYYTDGKKARLTIATRNH